MPFIPNYADAVFPDQAEPDSIDFEILLAGIRGDGVLSGCEVTAPGNMFVPTDISGLVAWFKADSLLLSDNDPVATWADSSGNANDLAQATSGAQPTYKTAIVNSMPVVRFAQAGTADYMQTVAFSAQAQPNTLFLALKCSVNGVVACDGIVNGHRHYVGQSLGNSLFNYSAGTQIDGGARDQVWHVHAVVFNGASSVARLDGGAASASGNAGSNDITGVTLGGNYNGGVLDGDIFEYLLYHGALSNADLDNVGNYMADRIGTAWTAVS